MSLKKIKGTALFTLVGGAMQAQAGAPKGAASEVRTHTNQQHRRTNRNANSQRQRSVRRARYEQPSTSTAGNRQRDLRRSSVRRDEIRETSFREPARREGPRTRKVVYDQQYSQQGSVHSSQGQQQGLVYQPERERLSVPRQRTVYLENEIPDIEDLDYLPSQSTRRMKVFQDSQSGVKFTKKLKRGPNGEQVHQVDFLDTKNGQKQYLKFYKPRRARITGRVPPTTRSLSRAGTIVLAIGATLLILTLLIGLTLGIGLTDWDKDKELAKGKQILDDNSIVLTTTQNNETSITGATGTLPSLPLQYSNHNVQNLTLEQLNSLSQKYPGFITLNQNNNNNNVGWVPNDPNVHVTVPIINNGMAPALTPRPASNSFPTPPSSGPTLGSGYPGQTESIQLNDSGVFDSDSDLWS